MGPQKRGETAKPRIYPDLGSFVRVSYRIVCYWDRRKGRGFCGGGVSASRGRRGGESGIELNSDYYYNTMGDQDGASGHDNGLGLPTFDTSNSNGAPVYSYQSFSTSALAPLTVHRAAPGEAS